MAKEQNILYYFHVNTNEIYCFSVTNPKKKQMYMNATTAC